MAASSSLSSSELAFQGLSCTGAVGRAQMEVEVKLAEDSMVHKFQRRQLAASKLAPVWQLHNSL
jgi:hypothetical protein